MKEQLIKELKRLQQDLIDRFDNEEADVVYDAIEVIQSIEPKEQPKVSAEEVEIKAKQMVQDEFGRDYTFEFNGDMYGTKLVNANRIKDLMVKFLHDYSSQVNAEEVKESAIGFANYCIDNLIEIGCTNLKLTDVYNAYLTNKEK